MEQALSLDRLRGELGLRFPDALPLSYRTTAAVATGIGKLDAMLPNGGLPRGRLSVWKPGGGATAVLRSACRSVVGRGERAAWIDPGGLVQGDFWTAGPLLIRPDGEAEALECAEELARCGGFGLVVLGAGRMPGALGVRLGRAVRAGGGALVVMTTDTAQAQLRITSRLVSDWQWRRDPFGEPVEPVTVTVHVDAASLGWSGHTEFRLPVLGYRGRLALDPTLVDRRGAPPAARRVASGTTRWGLRPGKRSCVT
jgi:hypothetical protein